MKTWQNLAAGGAAAVGIIAFTLAPLDKRMDKTDAQNAQMFNAHSARFESLGSDIKGIQDKLSDTREVLIRTEAEVRAIGAAVSELNSRNRKSASNFQPGITGYPAGDSNHK